MINVYVSNLHLYTMGKDEVGAWLSLPTTNEKIEQFLKDVIKIGVHGEEYQINDYESDYIGLEVQRYTSLFDLNQLAQEVSSFSREEEMVARCLISNDSHYASCTSDLVSRVTNGNWRLYENCSDMGEVAKIVFSERFPDADEVIKVHFNYDSFGESLACNHMFYYGLMQSENFPNYYVELYEQ